MGYEVVTVAATAEEDIMSKAAEGSAMRVYFEEQMKGKCYEYRSQRGNVRNFDLFAES